MKKVFIFFIVVGLLVGLIGCDTGLLPDPSGISPPAWILGTWADEFEINTWTFTNNNATLSAPYISFDFKELGKNEGVSITDTSTSTTYTIAIIEFGDEGTIRFEKVSNNTINYYISYYGITLGPIPLYKK